MPFAPARLPLAASRSQNDGVFAGALLQRNVGLNLPARPGYEVRKFIA